MTDIAELLRTELIRRGFAADLESPKETNSFVSRWATPSDLAELLDVMVSRREKVFRSVDVVGREAATASSDDAVLAIDAVKAAIANLVLARR